MLHSFSMSLFVAALLVGIVDLLAEPLPKLSFERLESTSALRVVCSSERHLPHGSCLFLQMI
jgi:hypothetical protein